MIIDPDFIEHWKTRMLVDLLDGDEMAPLYLIRIWGHCQVRRKSTFAMSNVAVKALCRFRGDADKLVESLSEVGWIEKQEDGSITVTKWDEKNSKLLSARENGKKGGRPPSNPPETQPKPKAKPQEPDKTGLDKTGLDGSKTPSDVSDVDGDKFTIDKEAYDELSPVCQTISAVVKDGIRPFTKQDRSLVVKVAWASRNLKSEHWLADALDVTRHRKDKAAKAIKFFQGVLWNSQPEKTHEDRKASFRQMLAGISVDPELTRPRAPPVNA